MPLDPQIAKRFEEWGAEPPSVVDHITEDELREKLIPELPTGWRQQGNQLIGDTSYGQVVNHIDPAYILTGTDENGLPQFRKIA